PAGTVHALGAGLLVAEIQQASDTTYRLYDWGRTGPDGKPRPLHVEPALAVTDHSAIETQPQRPQKTNNPRIERLVSCDKFVLNRWKLNGDERLNCDEKFHILAVLDGELDVSTDDTSIRLSCGQTVLLPACLGEAKLRARPHVVALGMHL